MLLPVVFWILSVAGLSHAAPYGPGGMEISYPQPGGGNLSLLVFGDEFMARTETKEGYTVVFVQADQCYYYAKVSADGESLESAGVKADEPAPRNLAKHVALGPEAGNRIAEANREKYDGERRGQWERRVRALRELR